jgi:hypothetical protein
MSFFPSNDIYPSNIIFPNQGPDDGGFEGEPGTPGIPNPRARENRWRWRFILATSSDLRPIGELFNARDKQLQLVLNRSGSCSFTLPMTDGMAEFISPLSTAILAYRWSTKSKVWRLIWSGYINTIDEDVSSDRMSVNAVGWLQRLEKRLLWRDLNFPYQVNSSTDDAAIISALLTHANGGLAVGTYGPGISTATIPGGPQVSWPVGSVPNLPSYIQWGGVLPNEGLNGSTAYASAYRGKAIPKGASILQQIIELTNLENGCDIWVDPSTRTLNVYRKKRRILSSLVFGYQWGPNNIKQFRRSIDASIVTNIHTSSGSAGSTPGQAIDSSSLGAYGPFEEAVNLSDVRDTTILQGYSGAEVAIRSQPRQISSITPFPFTEGSGIPEPYEDYDVGDQGRFSAVHARRISISNQSIRLFGISVSEDNEGNENIGQLQISPSS